MSHRRKLFCQISPLCYQISTYKCRALRHLSDALRRLPRVGRLRFTRKPTATGARLPFRVARHTSVVRRKLAQVSDALQAGKAVNLARSAPLVSGVLIGPGETFSFWRLVGLPCAKRGYAEGLTLSGETLLHDVGGGLCQFTNLIHWLVLHTPLTIVEHHHHDRLDLFPDAGRTVPFGTGTSILYNYLDYRFRNDTQAMYQLIVHTDGHLLTGELRSDQPAAHRYVITAENDHFVREGDTIYRCGRVICVCTDAANGAELSRTCIKENHARVLYAVEEQLLTNATENEGL